MTTKYADGILCFEFIQKGNANADIEYRFFILDPATGKLLRGFSTPTNFPSGLIAGHGTKLAFAALYSVLDRDYPPLTTAGQVSTVE